jgi:hypothetical protein
MMSWRPRVATWLFTCLLPIEDAESIVGDLEEEGRSRGSNVDTWYWAQVVRSFVPLFGAGLNRGGWLSTLAVALLACVCQAAIELVAARVAWGWRPSHMPSVPLTLVITLPSFIWLSYQATRIRPGAGSALAAMAAAALSLRLWLAISSGLGMPGDILLALVVAPSMALTGAFLALKDKRSLTTPLA